MDKDEVTEKNEENQPACLQKNTQDNHFSVREERKSDLKIVLNRAKKNPGKAKELAEAIKTDPGIVNDWIDVTKIKQDDHRKGRFYKRERASAYHRIPLDKISVDLKNFQNRQTPHSKHSVQGIMGAVFSERFKKALLNPCILRQNPEGRNVILAGHSRTEAFYRLSMIYQDRMHELSKEVQDELHELCEMYKCEYKALPYIVQTRCKKHDYYFDKLPSLFIHDISLDDARTIALMSNALASAETDIERANVYRCMRETKRTIQEIDLFGRICERSNRSRVRAYSFLNPDGLAISSLDRFESNQDESHIIKRIARWIGHLREKNQGLSNLHEDEMYDWLLNKGGYGTRKDQINSQSKFEEIMRNHIESLKHAGKFHPDEKLNVLKIQNLSFAMQEFYKILREIRQKKMVLYTEFHTLRRKYNKQIVKKIEKSDIAELEKKLYQTVNKPIDVVAELEKVEGILFDIQDCLDESNVLKIKDQILAHINKLEQEYYKLRGKKDRHINEGKKELALNFTSDIAPEKE